MNIVGLFCEDIRQEAAGTETIVGALPDNINMPGVPGIIPKLALYVRIQIGLNETANSTTVTLQTPWGETVSLGQADKSLLEQAQKTATDNNLPIAGVVMRAIMAPFPVQGYGLIIAVVNVGGVERICAMLNLKAPTSASA